MNLFNLMQERGITVRDLARLINNSDDDVCSKLGGTLAWNLTDVVIICDYFRTVNLGMFGVHLDSNT